MASVDEIADEEMYCLVQNGEWYDAQGRILGSGELSPSDLKDAQDKLSKDELLVVIAHPCFFLEDGPIDNEKNSLATRCDYLIACDHFYLVSDVFSWSHSETNLNGTVFRVISREVARELIARGAHNSRHA